MYWLYAEDTRDGARHPIAALRSCRFSRAMREAEKMEKARTGARYFVAQPADGEMSASPAPDMSTAAYLGVRRKPAPVGSEENQAHQRRTLRWQGRATRRDGRKPAPPVDWGETNDPGEPLGEVYVDMIRRDAAR
jgi:hypothetical protein